MAVHNLSMVILRSQPCLDNISHSELELALSLDAVTTFFSENEVRSKLEIGT